MLVHTSNFLHRPWCWKSVLWRHKLGPWSLSPTVSIFETDAKSWADLVYPSAPHWCASLNPKWNWYVLEPRPNKVVRAIESTSLPTSSSCSSSGCYSIWHRAICVTHHVQTCYDTLLPLCVNLLLLVEWFHQIQAQILFDTVNIILGNKEGLK